MGGRAQGVRAAPCTKKCWLLRKHGTFQARSGLSVFWGGGKGFQSRTSSTELAAFPLLDGNTKVLRRPPKPGSSLLRVFGALQDVAGSKSSPRDGICCSGGAPGVETPVSGVGSDQDAQAEVCSWSTDVVAGSFLCSSHLWLSFCSSDHPRKAWMVLDGLTFISHPVGPCGPIPIPG